MTMKVLAVVILGSVLTCSSGAPTFGMQMYPPCGYMGIMGFPMYSGMGYPMTGCGGGGFGGYPMGGGMGMGGYYPGMGMGMGFPMYGGYYPGMGIGGIGTSTSQASASSMGGMGISGSNAQASSSSMGGGGMFG